MRLTDQEIAKRLGLPEQLADRLRGETAEEIEADARALAEAIGVEAEPIPRLRADEPKGRLDVASAHCVKQLLHNLHVLLRHRPRSISRCGGGEGTRLASLGPPRERKGPPKRALQSRLRTGGYGAPVPPWIGPPSSPPWFWPVSPPLLVDEFPGSQPSLPLPRPALHFFFAGGSWQ